MNANSRHAWLYVTGFDNNVVGIFDLQEPGFPRIGLITEGINAPGGLAVDSKGKLYVTNAAGGNVTIYPPGKIAPSLTLSQGLGSPRCVAVDKAGNIYVCNQGSSPSITVFPPGKTSPSQFITSPLIQEPSEIAFDANSDLFFSDGISGVSEIQAGSQNIVNLGLQGLARTDTVGVDPVNGNLFVGTFGNSGDEVLVYEPGNVNPVRALKESSGADSETFGKVSGVEYFYVPESYNNEVHIFKQGSNQPAASITLKGLSYPVGIAFKAAGIP